MQAGTKCLYKVAEDWCSVATTPICCCYIVGPVRWLSDNDDDDDVDGGAGACLVLNTTRQQKSVLPTRRP